MSHASVFRAVAHGVRTLSLVVVDLVRLASLAAHSRSALAAENLFLRKQLALFQERKVKPRRADDATRWTMATLSRMFPWGISLVNVKPDTLIRWQRKGFRLFWCWKSKPTGRPRLPKDLRQLIREMAAENPTWGEERIVNELKLKLGIRVAKDKCATCRSNASSFANMANHRSAAEKSPSESVIAQRPRSCRRKRMAHEHGSEYQLKIVHEDETEELSGWMNCPEDVAQTITGLRGSPAKAYWLQVRNILCFNCLPREQKVAEFPLTPTATENSRFPRQTDRRPFTSASGRTSSAGA
jgi:hypothetical protein